MGSMGGEGPGGGGGWGGHERGRTGRGGHGGGARAGKDWAGGSSTGALCTGFTLVLIKPIALGCTYHLNLIYMK